MSAVQESADGKSEQSDPYVVLTGNPNCGKTTIFNGLTGLRAKVGNYAGVTVERKEGPLRGAPPGSPILMLDLPGTYSLSPKSLDEQISRDVLFHRLKEVPAPKLVVVVIDASNLERNLYYATQVIELGYPTIVALNMVDVATENGHDVDVALLTKHLGVSVYSLVGNTGKGIPELRDALVREVCRGGGASAPMLFGELPGPMPAELAPLASALENDFPGRQTSSRAEALLVLTDEKAIREPTYSDTLRNLVGAARTRLEAAGLDWRSAGIEARYSRIGEIHRTVVKERAGEGENVSDKLDRVLTHKIWGMLIFVAIMTLMFLSIFSFAKIPMDFLQNTVAAMGDKVGTWMSPGPLQSLLVNGVIKGVGAVIVFVPQICLLFFFIGLLEDTGYMSRAAFLMDRLMSRVGLHGKSFIPMLSSFACAIPGIMATRTIETPKDRLVTILVAPLMSCSARLPVYTLLIAACFPGQRWTSTLVMLSMYLLGIVMALAMAWLFKKTLLKGETPMLIMELPPYKRPVLLVVLRHMWDRSKLFLKRAGTVILGINIILWFLASYPKSAALEQTFNAQRREVSAFQPPGVTGEKEIEAARGKKLAEISVLESGERLRHSFAGRMGQAIEPIIAPLGFDWKMGIGIISSFAAREVFVSTMSIVYNVAEGDDKESSARDLAETLQKQRRPDGAPVYTGLTSITLMVFYVLAMQCISTVAVVRRETNSWKWPLFQFAYMTALAWCLAFVTYQGGKLLGF